MARVAIGVPHPGMVHAKFCFSFAQVLAYSTIVGIETLIVDQETSIIEKGRHDIVGKAMEVDATHVMFMDSDMVFPMNIIERLLKHERAIVGCDYRRRVPPHQKTARGKGKVTAIRGATEVAEIGTGCMLVDLEVFRKLGKPYFKVEWNSEKEHFQSEDYNLCLRASLLGYRIFCDYNASKEIIHIGQEGYVV